MRELWILHILNELIYLLISVKYFLKYIVGKIACKMWKPAESLIFNIKQFENFKVTGSFYEFTELKLIFKKSVSFVSVCHVLVHFLHPKFFDVVKNIWHVQTFLDMSKKFECGAKWLEIDRIERICFDHLSFERGKFLAFKICH